MGFLGQMSSCTDVSQLTAILRCGEGFRRGERYRGIWRGVAEASLEVCRTSWYAVTRHQKISFYSYYNRGR